LSESHERGSDQFQPSNAVSRCSKPSPSTAFLFSVNAEWQPCTNVRSVVPPDSNGAWGHGLWTLLLLHFTDF
jgi:hypothetical protein